MDPIRGGRTVGEELPVLSRLHFDGWSKAISIPTRLQSRTREPAGKKVPSGGQSSSSLRAWWWAHAMRRRCRRESAVRSHHHCGAWDGLIPDSDARWLFDALSQATVKRDIKIGRGTHLMHLESMRWALWHESVAFLLGEDVAPVPN